MRIQTQVAVALLMLAAGGVGWVLRGCSATGDRSDGSQSASDRSPSTEDVGRLGERVTDLTRRIAALESEVRAFRAEEAARWVRFQSEPGGLQPSAAGRGAMDGDAARGADVAVPAPDDPAAAERLRDRWRGVLAESEKRLWAANPSGPDPRGDLVAWSRFDDLKRAREALDRAQDMAALRALSEGEFKFYFKLER